MISVTDACQSSPQSTFDPRRSQSAICPGRAPRSQDAFVNIGHLNRVAAAGIEIFTLVIFFNVVQHRSP